MTKVESKIVLRITTPLYERLRAQAKRNRRSINSELLVMIEAALEAGKATKGK